MALGREPYHCLQTWAYTKIPNVQLNLWKLHPPAIQAAAKGKLRQKV